MVVLQTCSDSIECLYSRYLFKFLAVYRQGDAVGGIKTGLQERETQNFKIHKKQAQVQREPCG